MIFLNLIIVVIALIFFWLSYYTPRQETFFYFIAAMLFLFAAITGFQGYSDLPVGQVVETINSTATTTWTYSGNDLFNRYLPLTELLISLYLFISLIVIGKDGRDN